jgi:hypothetical protein
MQKLILGLWIFSTLGIAFIHQRVKKFWLWAYYIPIWAFNILNTGDFLGSKMGSTFFSFPKTVLKKHIPSNAKKHKLIR